MEIKNRAVMMPMATDMADHTGIVTPRQIRYYQERAKGGIGMIINEYTGVDDVDSIPSIHNLRIARDYHIAPLEELTDAVHLYNCKIVAQIHHGGATSNPAFTGRQNIAPSAVPIADGKPVPREMTKEDIKRVQQKFVDAAVRCHKAGYDAVELHGAHGYLIAQFFSNYYNRRQDEYGGSVENRCRFIAEIIAAIREKLGRYPILVRMCGDEMTPVKGFLTLEEGIEIAAYLEGCGIDAINISNGSARNGDANCEPYSYRPGWKKHVAKAYKQALHIPVIATNTIKSPEFAEELLEEGVCDFVGLGRSQLADPDFMNKARSGRADEIRQCIGCLYCRERVLGQGLPIRCAINARTAREIEFSHLHRNGEGKTVVVVGGGPAGMEAARVLALRKFHVILFEQHPHLGGMLNIANKPPLKEQLTKLVTTMARQIERLGVDIRRHTEGSVDAVMALHPDGVIMACGAVPLIPDIPGIHGANVVTAEDLLAGKVTAAGTCVIIGSGLTGLETAATLLKKKHTVALVEMKPGVGEGIFGAVLNDELSRISPYHPALYVNYKLCAISAGTVTLEQVQDHTERTLQADTVILAMGLTPRQHEIDAFRQHFERLRIIGDANGGGKIALAVRQGFEAAYTWEA
jgi:2,4-dienoyl-CoA reductase-like NADH-dependent reductase (Old Yellow Enzyme family)/thioredoxin reductase